MGNSCLPDSTVQPLVSTGQKEQGEGCLCSWLFSLNPSNFAKVVVPGCESHTGVKGKKPRSRCRGADFQRTSVLELDAPEYSGYKLYIKAFLHFPGLSSFAPYPLALALGSNSGLRADPQVGEGEANDTRDAKKKK